MLRETVRWKRALWCVTRASGLRVRAASLPPIGAPVQRNNSPTRFGSRVGNWQDLPVQR